jgi:hypothetical protein
MVDVAVRLHTPVYLQYRNAGGLPTFVYILASNYSTTLLYHSSKGQHHCGFFSVYNALNAEASCYTLSP